MRLFAPWDDPYLHNWIKNPNRDHQTLINILSKTVIYTPKLDKTITKYTVHCYVYK